MNMLSRLRHFCKQLPAQCKLQRHRLTDVLGDPSPVVVSGGWSTGVASRLLRTCPSFALAVMKK